MGSSNARRQPDLCSDISPPLGIQPEGGQVDQARAFGQPKASLSAFGSGWLFRLGRYLGGSLKKGCAFGQPAIGFLQALQ